VTTFANSPGRDVLVTIRAWRDAGGFVARVIAESPSGERSAEVVGSVGALIDALRHAVATLDEDESQIGLRVE
jgi:hypothetical protein